MLSLNNKKSKHDITLQWQPRQDYSENGSIVIPRGSLVRFKGKKEDRISLINKVFHDGLDRDNITFMINTVAQFPFKKDDIIVDDDGIEYKVVDTFYTQDENQFRYLKSKYTSKEWWILVEGDE